MVTGVRRPQADDTVIPLPSEEPSDAIQGRLVMSVSYDAENRSIDDLDEKWAAIMPQTPEQEVKQPLKKNYQRIREW
jgi:hypothetical protein